MALYGVESGATPPANAGLTALGTASLASAGTFATAAQGSKADAAIQPNSPLGYSAGAGGAVTQATNKSTGVTLNKLTGAITMNGAALAAAAEVTFTVTNSLIAATDCVIVNHASAGTGGAYAVQAHTIAAGSFKIMVGNMSAGSLSEALVIRFTIIKGAST